MEKEVFVKNYFDVESFSVEPFEGKKKYYSTGDFDSDEYELVSFDNRPSRANLLFKEGQICFAKMRDTGKIKMVTKEMEDNIYSTGFFTIRPKNIDSKYLYFLLSSERFNQEKNSFSFGTTQFSINENKLSQIRLPIVKDIKKQKEIVNLLEKKLDVVDRVIEKEEKIIEKLEEYKKVLNYQTVMCGLEGAKQKDVDCEWFNKVPSNWSVCRIKDAFTLSNNRTEETDLNKVNLISLYTDKGVLQHTDLEKTTGNKAVNCEGYKIVKENDIVVNIILCWMGAIGVSKFNGVTSPAYDIYSPKTNICSDYYHYLFRTSKFNGECFRNGRGIMLMRWRTYSTEFKAIKIPLPPYEEQVKIAEFLNKKNQEIDALIYAKNKKVQNLLSYKRSLIYEAVSGI